MELEQLAEELNNLKSGIEQDKYNSAKNGWYAGAGSPFSSDTAIGDVLFDTLYHNGDMSAESTMQLVEQLRTDIDRLSNAMTKFSNTVQPAVDKLKDQVESVKEIVDAQKSNEAVSDKVGKAEEAANSAADSVSDLANEQSAMPDMGAGDAMAGPAPAGEAMPDMGAGDAMAGPAPAGEAMPPEQATGEPPNITEEQAAAGLAGEQVSDSVSDTRMKNIKRYRIDFDKARQVVSDFRAKNVKHKEEGNISPNILAAASRGF